MWGEQIDDLLHHRHGNCCRQAGREIPESHGRVVKLVYLALSVDAVSHMSSFRSPSSYHRRTREHDPQGNIVAEAYFGVDGKPCLHADGYTRLTMTYDARGNQTALAFFGLD